MRSTWKAKVLGAAATLVLVPHLAQATSMEEQMELMQQRMSQLEDQLNATNDDLRAANGRVEDQQQVLDSAGLAEGGAMSSLSSFLSDTDFYGWVNTSYTQNFRSGVGAAGGNPNLPFHSDNMSFALNQVWFGMDRASTEKSRAGFHVDMLFGKDAGVAGNAAGVGSDAANSFELFTAYVSYLIPLGNGLELTAGKLGTLAGAEVVQSNANFNITRGLVWGLQPINNTGILASMDIGGGLSVSLGVLNDAFVPGSTDPNQGKAVTSQVAWSNDTFGAAATYTWGTDGVGPSDTGLLDILLTADLGDSVSVWANYDYIESSSPSSDVHGIALAARVAFGDRTGLALRGEYVTNTQNGGSLPVATGSTDAYSITATVDHSLTDNLGIRAEIRYDGADGIVFPGSNDDQWVGLIDATYSF